MYVVTGASSGIGHAITAALAKRQLRVLAAARTIEPIEMLAEQLPDYVQPVCADLACEDGIQSIVASLPSDTDVAGIVHSAGTRVRPEPYQAINTDDLGDHFRVHVASQIRLYQMLASKASVGRILTIDSYSATQPRDGWGAYSIIKAAAQMAARCAAQELGGTLSIRVMPGPVATSVVDAIINSDTKTATLFQALLSDGKVASPEEAAGFITAILVDASDEVVRAIDAWDYNNPEHQCLVRHPQ